jgi:hypothetical protein
MELLNRENSQIFLLNNNNNNENNSIESGSRIYEKTQSLSENSSEISVNVPTMRANLKLKKYKNSGKKIFFSFFLNLKNKCRKFFEIF